MLKVLKMKQGTIFEAFSKNNTLTESCCSVVQTVKLDGSTVTEDRSNNVKLSSTPAQSELVFDRSHFSEAATNKTKGLNKPILDAKLEEINFKSENKKSKVFLMQSGAKRSSNMGTKFSPSELKINNTSEPASICESQVDKSSMHLEIPLNMQSQENEKNMCVGSSDTDYSSSIVGKKVVDSMEYEDFIAQLAFQNKQQAQCRSQTLKSSEVNENTQAKKQTMSYSEFLKMFKSPTKDDLKSSDDEHETDEVLVPVKETRKEVKCKSIASIFPKIEDKSRQMKTSTSTTVTVAAEIYTLSQPTEESKRVRSTRLKKLPGKTENVCHLSDDDNNEIEFLGSETITEKATEKKTLATKKRTNETAIPLFHTSKKQKVAPQMDVQEELNMKTSGVSKIPKVETSFEVLNKQKVKIPSDISHKNIETPLEVSEKNNKPQSEVSDTEKLSIVDRNGILAKCEKDVISETTDTEEMEPASPAALTTTVSVMKTSQSTLCFRKTGLSLVKVTESKSETPADEESYLDAKSSVKELSKKLSLRRTKADNKSGLQRSLYRDIDTAEDECKDQHDQHSKNQHKRRHLSEPLVLATDENLSPQKDTKVVPETDVEIVESYGLRRSARLTRAAQAMKNVDVVEIGSESEEEEASSETKKRSKKGGAANTSAASEKYAGNSSKKSSGKLAPIFTSVKSKEQTERNVPQAVDPEQDRRRREFLMSGIPEELKRQITTATTNVFLDYPPFPRISHVQQILDGTSSSAQIKIPMVICTHGDGAFESIPSTSLMWENLGWKLSENSNKSHRDFLETFTINPPLQDSQLDLLLKDLQCSDSKYPFTKTYAQLRSKIDSMEASACGNKVVTEEEDDDVVVIDSSPVSERPVLKHASEPRASLWSELHQPESSEQIIGNVKAMKQLKIWLEEWKVLVEKQVRKANKASNSAKKNRSTGSWSDDSDFTDSDEEEMALCNSVLITGPHGVGKTASVYALAKELGYKIFEVNSSSLRSGKQLLAQLEEATQSHRVAQNNTKSSLYLDTPTAGAFSTRKEEKGERVKCTPKSKPVSSVNHAFANLFGIVTSGTQGTNSYSSQSGTKVKEKNLRPPVQESGIRGGISKKKSVQPADLKITESVPAKTDKRKKNLSKKEEIGTIKITQDKSKEEACGAVTKKQKGHRQQTCLPEVTSQTNSDCNMTSGSLNLTSASLILFDEADVVFEEDKGFLATVQHFMMSTKIPIVLTSTDVSFHYQLQARHDHIRLQQPPLISTASFLSTLCLAHGVRISHQSVLNAINYTKGDIRRLLLYLQYWCESGGGLVQVAKEISPELWTASIKNSGSGDVAEELVKDFYSVKTLGSRKIYSQDSDFISLRPPNKKARRIVSDDDSSQDATFVPENANELTTTKFTILKNERKQMKVILNGNESVTAEEELKKQVSNLPPLHIQFEESLLGLYECDLSATTILGFIKAPTLSCHGLDRAVHACSIINQAFNIDAIYHIVLHGLPLPKSDKILTQLILLAKQEAPASEKTCEKSRKRIIQGDWLDSDSSNEGLHQVKNLTQNTTKYDGSCCEDDVQDICVSVKASPIKEFSEKCNSQSIIYETESDSTQINNKLMTSVLSEFTRFYDQLSFTDCLELYQSSTADFGIEVKLTPGLSDEEKHSKLSHCNHEDWSYHIPGSVKVLAARKFCSSIEEHMKSFKRDIGDQDTKSSLSSNESCGWPVEFHLPVQKLLPDLWNIADKSLSSEPAYKNVSKCLGPTVQVSDPALHLDYMPYLREICRSEDQRRLAKSQRRFHHYLDSIGLSLKESTIASLTSTYVVSSTSQES